MATWSKGTRIFFNGVDLSAHVETVTFNPEHGPVTVFALDPVDEALRELLAAAGINPRCWDARPPA